MGQTSMKFLLDSGAVVSVVRSAVLPDCWHNSMATTRANTVAADGVPLEVLGQVRVPVTLGAFKAEHTFTVVKNLTVDCILGADFLVDHEVVIDCGTKTLYIGKSPRVEINFWVPQEEDTPAKGVENSVVSVSDTVMLPARSVCQVVAQVQVVSGQEGVVEPLQSMHTGVPKHLVGRTLTKVGAQQDIVIQMVNLNPTSTTIHKGMKIATFTPAHRIHPVGAIQGVVRNPAKESVLSDIDIDLTGSDLSPSEQEQLQKLVSSFQTVFAKVDAPLGRTSIVKHNIPTSGLPIWQPLRRLPHALKPVVDNEVQKMLSQGVIRKSSSPWCSPVVMVKKKDGSWRLCVDYRKVNAATRQDAYPLPRIDSTLDSLAGSKYFTTLDLASGYWQVEVEETAKEKTAFSTPGGHFEFNVMPFGLTNAPATFQRLMECVLAGLAADQCLVYLDDIIIFSESFAEHLHRLHQVLSRLQEAGLKLRPSKCHFVKREVRYLGHIVSEDGVRPDPSKTNAVSSYPTPTNVKELRQFLGLANYYRRFVENYSHIAEPLHQLTRKTSKGFTWTSACQSAFDMLKRCLTHSPILAYPDFSREFLLHTDASATALGAVLCQQRDGVEQVIAYWSRQLTKPERNYSTIKREALALVAAVKDFYPYLYGFPFKLLTDHNPLTALKGLKDMGGRLTRWMLFLQQFNFEIQYKPGKANANADALS